MPTSVNVTNLKINELTEAQYDTAVQGGVIGANELSILTDADAGQVIQVATLPTASADELGNIYQFTGTTDANYTNGYFYKCVSDGQTPATYSWTAVQVQAGGGSSLPSQTGNAGKFLTTDGTDASWGTTTSALKVQKTNTNIDFLYFDAWGSAGILKAIGATYVFTFAWAHSSSYSPNPDFNIEVRNKSNNAWVFGYTFSKESFTSSSTTTLGSSSYKWANVYTNKLNNGADITIPTTGGTMVVATPPTTDGTYVLKATVSDGVVTYAWVAE